MTNRTPAELADLLLDRGYELDADRRAAIAVVLRSPAFNDVVSRAVQVEWGTALRGADDERGHPTIWDPVRIDSEERARAAAGPNADGTETIVPVWRVQESPWFDASDEHPVTANDFVPRSDLDEANDRANANFNVAGEQHRKIVELTRDEATLKAIRRALHDMTLSDANALAKIRTLVEERERPTTGRRS